MVCIQKAAVGEGATPAKRRKLSEETTSGSSEGAPQQTEDQSKEGTTIGVIILLICILYSDSCRIYVGNLSYNVDEAALVSQFESCGKVTKVQFITDKATGKFYGFAYLFANKTEFTEAPHLFHLVHSRLLTKRYYLMVKSYWEGH